MDTEQFLRHILPTQGLYVLALIPTAGGPVKHKVFAKLDQMANAVAAFDTPQNQVYHGCATLLERRVFDDAKQRWRVRVASNVAFVKSQWLDLDVGPGKDYETRQDALAAIKLICSKLRVPAPTIVSSGRGLHAYWVFDADIPADRARGAMSDFRDALNDLGIKHDGSRTADLASILRPVGSTHRKGAARIVQLVKKSSPISHAAFTKNFVKLAGEKAPAVVSQPADHWGSGVGFAPADAMPILKQCKAMNDFAKARGQLEEPYWRGALGLLKHTKNGEAIAHKLSAGDKRYDHGETQAKMDGWGGGPTTCTYFEGVGAKCRKCPHRGKITSPIVLGEEVQVSKPPRVTPRAVLEDVSHYAKIDDTDQLPFWPKGYRWDGHYLQKWVKDKDNESSWVRISQTLYYPFLRYETEDRTRAIKICALTDPQKDRWRIFDIETTKVAEGQSLAYALGAHEVLYMTGQKERNREYVQDVLYGLKEAGLETTTYTSFGWHDDGFVIGDEKITAHGAQEVFLGSTVPNELQNGFGKAGTAQGWVQGVDAVYNRVGAEPFQFVLCNAFASPLVYLCGSDMWHGVPTGLTGASGEGKSTTAKVACSIYGDPRKLTVQANEEGTTMKALLQRISTMRHLPLVLDEITGRSTEELQALMFALSNGRSKMRLRADGTEINPGQAWDNLTFITGNLSIVRMLSASDVVKADATQVRCFEIPLPDGFTQSVFEGINAREVIEHDLLQTNYGVVGREWLQFLVANRKKITKLLIQERMKFKASSAADTRERFYYDLINTTMVAANLAKRLGYINFDLKALRGWALQHIRSLRVNRESSLDTPEDFLQSFLSHVHQHTLITRYFRDGRQRLDDERVVEPLREPVARCAIDDRKFVVTVRAFQEWCSLKQVDAGWLTKQLEKAGYITHASARHRLFKGTRLNGIQARCIELNYDLLDGTGIQVPDYITPIQSAAK